MKKKEFIKQVTGLFANQSFTDLHAILKEHATLTMENKKLISTLNDTIGDESVKNVINEMTQQQRVKTKNIAKELESAINSKDENLVFKILNPLSFAEQFKHAHIFMQNPDIYNKFLIKIIDGADKLTNKDIAAIEQQITYSYHLDIPEETVSVFTKKTNNLGFYTSFLGQKFYQLIYNPHSDNSQIEKLANKLFDTLEQYKKEDAFHPSNYFEAHKAFLPYLSADRLNKYKNLSNIPPANIVQHLVQTHYMTALDYFLNKQKESIEVSFNTLQYLVAHDEKYLKNITLAPHAEIDFRRTLHTLQSDPEFFISLINVDNVAKAIEEQKFKLDNAQLESVLNNLTTEEAQILFNKNNLFNLDENQRDNVNEFVQNFERHLVKKLCSGKSFQITEPISKFINENFEKDDFISKLNKSARATVLDCISDYSKVTDVQKFIKTYLEEMETSEYDCYYSRFTDRFPSDKKAIQEYIFSNKVTFNDVKLCLWDTLQIAHLVPTDTKNKLFAAVGERDIEQLKQYDDHLSKQEKDNLIELTKYLEESKIKKNNKVKIKM